MSRIVDASVMKEMTRISAPQSSTEYVLEIHDTVTKLLWLSRANIFRNLELNALSEIAASAEIRQALARLERIYLRGLADPGALLTILAGVSLIMTKPSYYLHAPWLHIKLTFVLLLIVLHGIVAMRTKAFATGRIVLQRSEARMLVAATLFLLLSILIATLVGQVYLT